MLLADDRVDVNITDHDNASPIWIAANNGHEQLIYCLLASWRHFKLTTRTLPDINKSYADMTAVDILRARFPKKQSAIATLENYQSNPNRTRLRLRQQLGLIGKDWVNVFALIVVYSDGYYRLNSNKASLNQARFFNMMRCLPMAHQMIVVSCLLDMDVKDGFPISHLNKSLDRLIS